MDTHDREEGRGAAAGGRSGARNDEAARVGAGWSARVLEAFSWPSRDAGTGRSSQPRPAAGHPPATVAPDHVPGAPEPDEFKSYSSAAVELLSLPGGRPSARDFGSLARDGYLSNPIVYRCLRLVSEATATVPWRVTLDGAPVDSHPILDLLACPVGMASTTDLIEAVVSHLFLSGNAYLHGASTAGRLTGISLLRPDRLSVVTGRDGWPTGFNYRTQARTIRFALHAASPALPDPVLHLAFFHPLDDHYGHAPVNAAGTAIAIHNTACQWNRALLDNAARPSGALVYQSSQGRLSRDQFERLKAELEAGFQGARNAGRPLLLEGGLDWKSMGYSPKDMDFIEAKNSAARDIALALGVPPMLLGIPGDNTYSNYREAQRAFWRQTVLPLSQKIASGFQRWLQPLAGGQQLEIVLERNQLSALSEERDALWNRISQATFLSDDEKRIMLGLASRSG